MKASLLSGLVFPGIGHLVLKQYLRASILIVIALAATSEIVSVATRQALSVVDRIYSGDVPTDSGALTEMLSNSSDATDSTLVSICWLVLGACWLFGIVDSYRIGRLQDIGNAPEAQQ